MRKIKYLCTYILFTFVLSGILIPFGSVYAVNPNARYVWSSSIETSVSPSEIGEAIEEKSRQFLRTYIYFCYLNGSKIWQYIIWAQYT